MERKLDSDIEEIRDVLLSGASQPVWNKQDVWARIEQKESKKRVWPFALAACVALVSLFVFWKITPEETAVSDAVTPMVQSEGEKAVASNKVVTINQAVASNQVLASNIEIAPKTKIVSVKPQIVSSFKTQGSALNESINEIQVKDVSRNLNALSPIEISRIETEVSFNDIDLKPVAAANLMLAGNVDILEKKEALEGKKITLIIPEEDKEGVRSNVKVVRFIQRVGEYNRTGDWEPEKKNKIGELWVKFLESTKTNEKSKL
ncbi:hypothetical protein [uncultured Arcticibacterium sp.]|uniref:hypothetical protein n=1 Tax=uncultured Arcticibacterium sp. TaxID=2173042 RepID=UPI0030FB9848